MDVKFLLQNGILVLMPILGGLIGWVTNFVAIKMLLKPVQPKKILGLTFQGLIPKRQSELASRISKAIAKDFLTDEDLVNLIKKIDAKELLQDYIKKKWNEKIGEILSSMPMIQMFLPPEKLEEIRDKVAKAFSGNSEELLLSIADGLKGKIDITDTIEKNILSFDVKRLESIINEIAYNEFRYIERLGGLIGFIIGLVQAILVYLFFNL